jgi:hypothetical protein
VGEADPKEKMEALAARGSGEQGDAKEEAAVGFRQRRHDAHYNKSQAAFTA